MLDAGGEVTTEEAVAKVKACNAAWRTECEECPLNVQTCGHGIACRALVDVMLTLEVWHGPG